MASAEAIAAPAQDDTLLAAENVSLGYGTNVVLEGVQLRIPRRGITGIMGPAGAGKTTLLRALAGHPNPSPAYWVEGRIRCAGRDMIAQASQSPGSSGAALLAQKDRLYSGTVLDHLIGHGAQDHDGAHTAARAVLEAAGLWPQLAQSLADPVLSLPLAAHKKILLARMLVSGPDCLLVDEPLSDVALADEEGMIEFLRALGCRRSLVVVLHNKPQARRLCDVICLVAGGGVAEVTAADQFFREPRTACGREFLQRGSSWPTAAAATVPDAAARAAALRALPWSSAPILREFRWVIEGLLGGAQRPGLLGNDDEDLRALQQLGVKHLVSLTEESLPAAPLAARGIASTHVPVPDMGVPSLQAADRLCTQLRSWMARGEPSVLHCRAGLGRTGTLLACVLVRCGADAGSAIQAVRRANPRYIQTERQLQFVSEFQLYVEHARHGVAAARPTAGPDEYHQAPAG